MIHECPIPKIKDLEFVYDSGEFIGRAVSRIKRGSIKLDTIIERNRELEALRQIISQYLQINNTILPPAIPSGRWPWEQAVSAVNTRAPPGSYLEELWKMNIGQLLDYLDQVSREIQAAWEPMTKETKRAIGFVRTDKDWPSGYGRMRNLAFISKNHGQKLIQILAKIRGTSTGSENTDFIYAASIWHQLWTLFAFGIWRINKIREVFCEELVHGGAPPPKILQPSTVELSPSIPTIPLSPVDSGDDEWTTILKSGGRIPIRDGLHGSKSDRKFYFPQGAWMNFPGEQPGLDTGWKFHILTESSDELLALGRVLIPFFCSEGWNFKTAVSIDKFNEFFGDEANKQFGKGFVVYIDAPNPADIAEVKTIAHSMREKIIKKIQESGVGKPKHEVKGDAPVPGDLTGRLYHRYEFTSPGREKKYEGNYRKNDGKHYNIEENEDIFEGINHERYPLIRVWFSPPKNWMARP